MNCSPTFYKIIKKKDVEEFKPDPYIATFLKYALWLFYGVTFRHPIVDVINSIVGLVFELIYIFIFYVYAKREQRVRIYFLFSFLFFPSVFLTNISETLISMTYKI
jgi:solute carrier family 50 protein (sugar transporter)